MRRLIAFIMASALLLAIAVPALAADGTVTHTGRVLISVQGDVSIPSGDQADVVLVVNGNATVAGTVETLTVIRGTATLTGAQVGTLAIVDGTAILGTGTTIDNNVFQLNSTVQQAEGVVIGGSVQPMGDQLLAFGLFLGLAALALWLGLAISFLVAGLLLAAFAARQVRTTEAVISHEPLRAFLVGLGMAIIPPILAVLLMVTIVGAPLGFGMLFVVWPALAFIGYLVAAIWLGEWLLRASGRKDQPERPYLGAVVGIVVAGIAGLIPFVSAIIALFGIGAVTVAGWRTVFRGGTAQPTLQQQAAPA